MSCNLESTYHVAYEDDDEPDNSEDMYNEDPNHDAPRHPNTHSLQNCDDTDGMTDNEDDSSVE